MIMFYLTGNKEKPIYVDKKEFIKYCTKDHKEIIEAPDIVPRHTKQMATRLHTSPVNSGPQFLYTMFGLIKVIEKNEILANIILSMPFLFIEGQISNEGRKLPEISTSFTKRRFGLRTTQLSVQDLEVDNGVSMDVLRITLVNPFDERHEEESLRDIIDKVIEKNLFLEDTEIKCTVLEVLEKEVQLTKFNKYITRDYINTNVIPTLMSDILSFRYKMEPFERTISNILNTTYTKNIKIITQGTTTEEIENKIRQNIRHTQAINELEVEQLNRKTEWFGAALNKLLSSRERLLQVMQTEYDNIKMLTDGLRDAIERLKRHPLVDWIDLNKDELLIIHTKNLNLVYDVDKINAAPTELYNAHKAGLVPCIGTHKITINLKTLAYALENKTILMNNHVEGGHGCIGTFGNDVHHAKETKNLTKLCFLLIQILQTVTINDPWGTNTLVRHCVYIDMYGMIKDLACGIDTPEKKRYIDTHINDFITLPEINRTSRNQF